MALVRSGNKELDIGVKNDVKTPKQQEILDEDTYIKVIQSDSCVSIHMEALSKRYFLYETIQRQRKIIYVKYSYIT